MRQNVRKNHIELMNTTSAAGGTAVATRLPTLVGRPNGKYAMLIALEIVLSYTATETSTSTLTAEEMYQVLTGLTLRGENHTRFNGFSGMSLMRRAVQAGEFFSPEQFASFADVTDVTATGAVTTKFYVPLAWGAKFGDFRGGIPLSELNRGELSISLKANPIESTDGSNYFEAGTITVVVTGHTVELDRPTDILFCQEKEVVESNSVHAVDGSGERRYAYVLIADDVDSSLTALTLPTGFSITIDSSQYANSQVGARYVDHANLYRQDGCNDILPAALPVFSLDFAAFSVDNMPLVRDKLVLTNVNAQHSGGIHKVISAYCYRPSRDQLTKVWTDWGVSPLVIQSYFAELDTPSGDASIAHDLRGVPLTHIDGADLAADARIALKA
jgi:hypothetical protein